MDLEKLIAIKNCTKENVFIERDFNNPDARYIYDVGLAEDGTYRTFICEIEYDELNNPVRYRVEKYPVRFMTTGEETESVASMKRIIACFLKRGLFGIFLLLICKDIIEEWLYKYIENHQLTIKEEHWSQPVKEIRRVFKWFKRIDFVSIVLEYDNAYRYRLQDFLMCIEERTMKGLKKALNIFISREHDRNVKLWKIIYKNFWILYLFKGKIESSLRDLNIDEVKLSIEDTYWTNQMREYDFRGLTLEQRREEYLNEIRDIPKVEIQQQNK